VWRLLRRRGARATVVFHEPFAPELLPDRKQLAAEAARIIATSAAALRQNRPAVPLPAPVVATSIRNLTDAKAAGEGGLRYPNTRFAAA